MKLTFSLLFLISTFAVSFAKEEKAAETEPAVKDDAAVEDSTEPLTDGSGAKTEGGSSDFDIEQLLKLIEALKNQDFDEVDRNLKDTKHPEFDFSKFDNDKESSEKETADKKEPKSESSTTAAPVAPDSDLTDSNEEPEFEKMEL